MKSLARWLSLPIAIVVALALVSPVAAGGPSSQPDAQVRRAGGPKLGGGIINLDAAGQTVGGHKARRYHAGAVRWFYVYVYNLGPGAERFYIDASTPADTTASLLAAPFMVQYFSPSGDEITTAVESGSFSTPTLATGGLYGIKAKVTVTSAAMHGSSLNLLLTVEDYSFGTYKDAVGISMRKK